MEMPALPTSTELTTETPMPIIRESDESTPDFQELPAPLEKKNASPELPLAVPSKSVESVIPQKKAKSRKEEAAVHEKAKPITPPPSTRQPEALPVKKVIPPKAEIPKAIPTRRENTKVLPPVSRQEIKPLPIRQNITAGKVVQRTPEQPVSSKPIPAEKPSPVPSQTEPAMPHIQPVEFNPQAESEKVEFPMRIVANQRRQFAKGFFDVPMPVFSQNPAQSPLVRNPQKPLFSPQKYRFESNAKNYDQLMPVNEHIQASEASLSMDLADTISPVVHAESTPDSVHQMTQMTPNPQPAVLRAEAPVFRPFNPAAIVRKETPIRSASGNAVQREVEQPSENPEPQAAPKTDYKKLAEDVYPFVKRLLEIEKERSRGNLR
jgi:hypothetical protein